MLQVIPLQLGIDRCYILKSSSHTILIDGGAPPLSGDQFLRLLAKTGIQSQEIDLILLTHGHLDHIGVVADIQKLTDAPIALHEQDKAFLESGSALYYQPPGADAWGTVMSVAGKATLRYMVKLKTAKVGIALGTEGMDLSGYGIPGRVVYTPGHSWGSVTVVLEDGRAFVGDLANNTWWLGKFFGPGLPALAEDMDVVRDSWKELKKLGVHTVYPAHGNSFPAEIMWKAISKK